MRPLRFNLVAPRPVFRSGVGATVLTEPCDCADCMECELRAMRARVNGESADDVRVREAAELRRYRREALLAEVSS